MDFGLRDCPDCGHALRRVTLFAADSPYTRKKCDGCGKLWCDIDGFAGAGGASDAMAAAGIPPDEAFNHSPEAIAIHAANHPTCRHHCEDVHKVNISVVVGPAFVNSGWFSPDCTHHSKAKGGKPLDNRRRGLCWVIIDWLDALGARRPLKIYLENVEEFEHYGPLGADGRPDKARRGELFKAFVAALAARGYRVDYGQMAAMRYGAGTSRNRLYMVARRDGRAIVSPQAVPVTHGDGLLPFVPAAACIDWTIPCPSIFDRVRPLVPKTEARLAKGIRRFVFECGDPFIVPVTHQGDLRTHSIREPLRTITTAQRGEHALIVPTLVQTGYGEREGQSPRALDIHKPLGTIVAGGGKHALVAAFLAQHNLGAVGHDAREPVSTIVGRGTQQQVVTAHLMNMKGDGRHRDPRAPMFTPCAGGNHIAEVRAFLMKYHGSGGSQLHSLKKPFPTLDCEDRLGLVTVHGSVYQLVDIGMRMLHWRELARAQGFRPDYKFDVPFTDRFGRTKPMTKTAIVRGIGNSVSFHPAHALIAANENAPLIEMQEAA